MSARGWHPDLPAMVEAVEIQGPLAYSLRGAPRDLRAAGVAPPEGAPAPAADDPPLLPYLASELYTRLYTRGPDTPPPPLDIVARRDFAVVLSAGNTGTGTWEAGWRVAGVDPDGRVVVVRDGVAFWAAPEGVRAGGTPVPGAPCRVRVGKELRQLLPGFYVALGDGDAAAEGAAGPLVRCYWHLTPEGAPRYIAAVTRRLNAARIPFRTKVVADPAHYQRADAGVLYLERADFGRARALLRQVYDEVRAHLRPAVPMLTLRLADGWSLAEDPGDGRSFGQARCESVARALWRCHRESVAAGPERVARVAALLRAGGVDPLRPYLCDGARDPYSAAARRAARAAAGA